MDEVWNLREQTIADEEKRWLDNVRRKDGRWARLCGRELPDVSPLNSENLSEFVPHPTSVITTPKGSDETTSSEPELLLSNEGPESENSSSIDQPADKNQAEEPAKAVEGATRKVRLRDTTNEPGSQSIAIIGGVRAPRKQE